jgi:PilZ domain
MAKQRVERGTRKSVRIDLHTAGFLISAPNAPWIACTIIDVSENGVCLDVGDLAVPKLFGLTFTSGGEVLRICSLIWRRGERIGARFVSAKELRQGLAPAEADSKPDRAARRAAAKAS